MTNRLTRRRWIALGGSAMVAAIAGCSSGDGGEDGGDDGDDGGDDGGTDGGTDGDSDGETDGGTDGGTDGDSDGGTDGDSDGGTDGDSDGGTDGDAATFGDSLGYPESYAFTITAEFDASGITTFDGRYHQGDMYYEVIFENSENIDFYVVDGDTYFITGDMCVKNPGDAQDPTGMDPENFLSQEQLEAEAEQNPHVEPLETTTLEGDEVRVYEVSDQTGQIFRYYILTESGFPRRMEWEDFQIDFTDHNNVQPISAPDMDCQEM